MEQVVSSLALMTDIAGRRVMMSVCRTSGSFRRARDLALSCHDEHLKSKTKLMGKNSSNLIEAQRLARERISTALDAP